MPLIPDPDASGFTTTPVPLYWTRYRSPHPSEASLILLHGGPGADHRYMLPQMLELRGRRDLILYDQRGGGRSVSPSDQGSVTWETDVADLAAVIAEVWGGPDAGASDRAGRADDGPVLLGYSWGGLLAMLYAVECAAGRQAPAPSRMVLIDPAPPTRQYRAQFEAEFARRQEGQVVAELRRELAASGLRESDPEAYRHRSFELSVAGYFADPRAARDLTPFRVVGRIQQSVWASLGDYDLLRPGVLDRVRCPALVIHGREDPIPLASSAAAARALDAELVVIEGCGHVPYVEKPNELFPAIEAFLSRRP